MSSFKADPHKSAVDSTEWTEYVHYHCNSCEEPCINHVSDSRTENRECYSCSVIADLERARLDDDGDDDPRDRQAGDVVCGRGSRAQDGQKPGTGEARARNVPRSEHGVAVAGDDE